MRGQPRSPSHFHTQVEEAWEAKDIDEVSPQSEVQRGCPPLKGWRVKGKPCPNISTDQPPEVVISVPDARSTEAGVGVGVFLPTPLSLHPLSFILPHRYSHTSGPSGTTSSLCEILARQIPLHSVKKRSARQDSLNHITSAFSSSQRNKLFLRTSAHCS